MSWQFGYIVGKTTYKGHTIEQVDSPMQTVYCVDGDYSRGWWSMADAKRVIRGEAFKFYPADVRDWLIKK